MMNIMVVVIWILATLAVSSLAVILGKRYGVEYPIALVAALSVLAGIFANKIVMFGPFTVPGGVIVFSMTFLITDLISEKWGKSYARKAVWAGLFANLLLFISLYIVLAWEPAPFAAEQAGMFAQVLSLTPRIAVAGVCAYLISQHHDIWAFHFWKRITKGKHLWFRNNASTVVSQFIDSIVFVTIAFYGVFPIWQLILGQWVVKVLIALLDTPFMYVSVWLMDRVRLPKRRSALRLA